MHARPYVCVTAVVAVVLFAHVFVVSTFIMHASISYMLTIELYFLSTSKAARCACFSKFYNVKCTKCNRQEQETDVLKLIITPCTSSNLVTSSTHPSFAGAAIMYQQA